ncbi:OLC1v1000565C1 [Oldenlandia corymbosa var. corymbosa]|uniref:OLC1v1000565C1 n=1 Tax=Oldenlandia corymbosa var. corymbosa TaxID=529605 RepID=A0AAV1D440_OLDCO|nr:OLC1v1000565C1 [Oldenlandia corymbosa var. corymbosa]
MANNSALSLLLLTLVALFILKSPATTALAAKDAPLRGRREKQEPYKVVNEFCNHQKMQRVTISQDFCKRVLKSDLRSASAKDNVALLLISVDLVIGKLNKTREYYLSTVRRKSISPPAALKPALEDCANAYERGIGQLELVPVDVKDDPTFGSYDALLANDALKKCGESLKMHRISDYPILIRHRSSARFVQLCVDISMNVS